REFARFIRELGALLVSLRNIFVSLRDLLGVWCFTRELGAFTREFARFTRELGAFTREFARFTRELGAFTREYEP
ncbi:hypothetical protein, partial [Peribacillus simplex]|uniref:hypothetical protein n=1 Tax=Peribacillus simplex TaxID=1478 RepID=UPI003D29473F